jgi:DNA repair exonuclease SbcCD nuclease subunit
MRALVTADLHLNDQVRDHYRHLFLRTFRDLCRKHKVDTAIILGDITDAKDRHSSWLVNQIVDHFYKLAGICEHVIVLRGNHDYVSEAHPFFMLLRRVGGIRYINQPTTEKNVSTSGSGVFTRPSLWLPHTNNPKKEWAGIDTKGAELIFAHQTFNGASIGPRKLEGIDPDELLPGKAQIISGDIHVPQTFGRVTYVGAPYTVDFGDNYFPRVLLLDTERGWSNAHSFKAIPCDGPQKRLIEAISLEGAKRECEKVATSGDILKIRIAVDSIERWPETREAIREWCTKQGLVPHIVQPLLKAKSSMASKQAVSAARSDSQALKDYGRLRKVDEPVLKTGLSLLEEI